MATITELLGQACVEPALIFLASVGGAAGALLDTPDRPFPTRPVPMEGLSPAAALPSVDFTPGTRVELLRKSARNPFRSMITVGRTGNNDVIVDSPIVSKVHCTFSTEGERWFVTDTGSTNGTFVEGARLRPHERRALVDGVELAFGEVRTVFVLPATLRSLLAPLARARGQGN